MPADGLVLEVNDYNWTDIVTNQYSNRQLQKRLTTLSMIFT